MASNANQDWDTARNTVRDNASELAELSTHTELYQWAKDQKLATKSLFPKFKTELRKQLKIDYDQIKADTLAAREQQLLAAAAEAPRITLWTAGDVEVDSFAVCNTEGGDPWYGDLHERDNVDDQDSADLAAARKAIYLAGQARAENELECVGLTVLTCNHHVTVEDLRVDMLRSRVAVTVEVVDDAAQNPALELCRTPGYRGWREVSLNDLLATVSQEV